METTENGKLQNMNPLIKKNEVLAQRMCTLNFGIRGYRSKHKINTENAIPTKQPPLRLPHPAAEFVDKESGNIREAHGNSTSWSQLQDILAVGKGSTDRPTEDFCRIQVASSLNASEVRSFTGLCSYYRRFIKGFSSIAKPPFKLTEKGRDPRPLHAALTELRALKWLLNFKDPEGQTQEELTTPSVECEVVAMIDSVSNDLNSLQDNDENLSQIKAWVNRSKRPEYSDIKHRKRSEILELCHDARTSGHLRVHKTLERVRDRFYWTGLQSDVRSYVTGCPQCKKRKNLSAGKSYMQVDQTDSPLERIATDIMGPMPETNRTNKYLLVIADYFTKWTEAYPMKNMEGQTVAEVLVGQFFTRFGVPEVIHSDQGRQYESRMFKDICSLLGIRKTRTTAFHPKSDGMVERFNKTLATMLSAYVLDHQTDWDKHLPYVLMAYCSAIHESTGYTPNMLMLGREISTPLYIMYGLPGEKEHTSVHEYVWKLHST
ncbi:uncharacterized protein K02A2.6-like [Saccostrea echinata]|uniref:uncharacterized protein K02A2.6-like n=1 Tax=Saccostrea echinata TaxID=191078 RepID=UPI002A812D86|nr:uncharacterized protein K02A2.6-like [Saccostrea echinata]